MTTRPDPFPGSASVSRLTGWTGLGVFSALLLVGVVTRFSAGPVLAVIGSLVALGAGVPFFLGRPRFPLGFAAAATCGLVVLRAPPGDVCWFAVIVLGIWTVLSAGMRAGAIYATASVVLLGGEWLTHLQYEGWGNWIGGTALGVLGASLVRHELVLVERLRAAQGDLAERSRAEERNRIARELHDVIAHSLTISLLHVSSARLAIEHDPADAARSLAEAERLGRQSLNEVRVTMGLLRTDSGEPVLAPVPGVDQLAELVQQVRDAGADVSLIMDGNIADLPSTAGSTVYRIVQEALTNAVKHAPGTTVVIRVGRPGTAELVDLTIDSSGRPGHGSGLGLLSMEERAEAVGGTCRAGPGGRGWLVHAVLPLRPDARLDAR